METDNKCSHCGNNCCETSCSANDSGKMICSCSLDSETQTLRLNKIKKEIFNKSIECKELINGLEFKFQESAKFTLTLLEFIEFERECCKDFTFSLTFEPVNGPVTLRITGIEAKNIFLK